MPPTSMSIREFHQDVSRAESVANAGPVFITERGRPAYVLLSFEDYRKLAGDPLTLGEALAQPDVPDFEFAPPRAGRLYRPADL